MNTRLKTAASLMALALAAGPVLAQDAAGAKTREQVRAELIEAQQRGEVMVDGETGRKLNELFPRSFPARMTAQGRTRAEVKAELLEAQRRGEIMMGGDSESSFNAVYPYRPRGRSRSE